MHACGNLMLESLKCIFKIYYTPGKRTLNQSLWKSLELSHAVRFTLARSSTNRINNALYKILNFAYADYTVCGSKIFYFLL